MFRKAATFFAQLALATLLMPLTAFTQSTPHGHWVRDPKGLATDAFVYDAPPAGFDPLKASDDELQDWGLPPRPSVSDMNSYARWKKIVTFTRIIPELKFTEIYNGSARNPKVVGEVGNSTLATSENWSGYVVYNSADPFASSSTNLVQAYWTGPAVTYCPGAYAASSWVGFDGWASADVLQAGLYVGCKNYYVWYEWYPNASTGLSLGVGPGDYLYAEVLYRHGVTPPGYAYIVNETTLQSVAIAFGPPSGTTYVGDSAEWIEERPVVNGSLVDLPDYGSIFFYGSEALGAGGSYFPNSVPAGSILQVQMTCPPWNPASSCPNEAVISNPGAVLGPVGSATNQTFQVVPAGPAIQ